MNVQSMTSDFVIPWLRKKVLGQAVWSLLGGVALSLLGIVIVVVTFCVLCGVSGFILRWLVHDDRVYLAISAVVVVLLFIGNARADRKYLNEFSVTTGTFSDEVVTVYLPGLGLVSNVNPLAPDTAHTFVKIITNILYTGLKRPASGEHTR